MNLVLPFVIYTFALIIAIFLGYRMYRYGRKHWCPTCRYFSARPQYVREVPPWAIGSVYSQQRLCYTRKVCQRCGYERALTPTYVKHFTLHELEKGEKQSKVLSL